MCRNIRPLFNYAPPASDEEIREAALQFVRKVSGFTRPSQSNQVVFDRTVDAVAGTVRELLDDLHTTAPPRDRELEAARARARNSRRFGAS